MNKRIKKKKEIEILRKYFLKLCKFTDTNKKSFEPLARASWWYYKRKGINVYKFVNKEYTSTAIFLGPEEATKQGYPIYKKDLKNKLDHLKSIYQNSNPT